MRYLGMLIIVTVTVLFAGCQFIDEPIEMVGMQGSSGMADMQGSGTAAAVVDGSNRAMEHRFGGSQQQAGDAVESALVMTKKYQELSIETEKLRQENGSLKLENADLNRQISNLKGELAATRTELTEANEFLQQMHAELGKWKTDVLGYRDEMRRAQVAELEALKKILKILGAELTEPIQQAKLAKEG